MSFDRSAAMIRLRFVTGKDFVSRLILAREGPMAPWIKDVPSHVELVVAEGYLGAHDDGGVQIRPVGYDKSYLAAERFVDVSLPAGGGAKAEAFARSRIDEPYDFAAILDLALPAPLDLHEQEHCICSAFMTETLTKGGAFSAALALPPYLVSPVLLLFWLSGRMALPAAAAA
jgi:hypothetical protein